MTVTIGKRYRHRKLGLEGVAKERRPKHLGNRVAVLLEFRDGTGALCAVWVNAAQLGEIAAEDKRES